MRMLTFSSSLVVAGGLALAACSDRLVEEPPPLGGSVTQNMAAQIVDPVPDSTEVAPPLNGVRNNGAQKRYESGKVTRPRDVRTSTSSSTTGGGTAGN